MGRCGCRGKRVRLWTNACALLPACWMANRYMAEKDIMDSFAIGRALDLVEEVDAAAKNAPQNIFSVASNFWETIFTGRGRDPDLKAFLNLLHPPTNATLWTTARFCPTSRRL